MTNDPNNPDSFPLREARALTRDLMQPAPWIYWIDFLLSVSLGWAAFFIMITTPFLSFINSAAYIVTTLALYRAVIFTHELSHLKKGTFKVFRLVWNLLCGFPLMAPSFMYHGVHNDHHARDEYGTYEDGEYLPFGAQSPNKIIMYLLLIFILPVFFAVRFLILTPLALIIPKLRPLIWRHASSLTIDLTYKRPAFSKRDDKTSYFQELITAAYAWAFASGIIIGFIPMKALLVWYAVLLFIFLLNSLRTLAAHAYRNPGDQQMSVSEQFLDSVDVPGNPFITSLWAPVGLRFHATHHLFPNMPYHALPKAHDRLKHELKDNRQYLLASRHSLFHALKTLWQDAKKASS